MLDGKGHSSELTSNIYVLQHGNLLRPHPLAPPALYGQLVQFQELEKVVGWLTDVIIDRMFCHESESCYWGQMRKGQRYGK